jgi:hypothetical protein
VSFRFRRSVRLFPGVRLNFSKSGISASIGGAPFTLNVGSRGLMSTASIPGTGISFRQYPHRPRSGPRIPYDPPRFVPSVPEPAMDNEIRSEPASEVSSEGLAALLKLLKDANAERRALQEALPEAQEEEFQRIRRFEKRRDGFLLKRLLPKQLARFEAEANDAQEEVKKLKAQLEQAVIRTELEVPEKLMDEYGKLRQSFEVVSSCHMIWDVVGERKVDPRRERSNAGRAVDRKRVDFILGRSEILSYAEPVPLLRNRNGGDLYVYPGFLLVVDSPTAFGLVDLREISVEARRVQCTEEEAVPSDAERVGITWRRVNADGSPDRRYRDNSELPLVIYGSIRLHSMGGLDEEYQFSNALLATAFGTAFQELVAAASEELGPLPSTDSLRPAEGDHRADLPASLSDCGDAVQELLRMKPPAWEYLLFVEMLRECLVSSNANAPHDAVKPRLQVQAPTATMGTISALAEEMQSHVTELAALVTKDLQAAIGPPGEPASPESLLLVARSMGRCHTELIDFIRQLRAMNTREYFAPIRSAFIRSAQAIIGELEGYPDRVASGIQSALTANPGTTLNISFRFRVDPELDAAMKIATEGVRRDMGT